MPDIDERAIRTRATWSGTLSFGLVSIPVYLLPATRPRRVSLRMLDDDGTPLSRRYYDPVTDREVSRDQLVRGYEIAEDEFVVVSAEELEALEPEKSRDIDLRQFVDSDAIDPIYYDRAYFLAPAGDSTKAYRLLAAVMEQTGRAGIATFVMRTREYLVAILADHGILRAETLRFHDEIRGVEEIDLPDRPEIPGDRVDALEAALEDMTRDDLDESELEDRYADRLFGLVEAKRKKRSGLVTAPAGAAEDNAEGQVIDLMDVLKRSLQDQGRGADADVPRRARSSGDRGSAEDLSSMTRAELYERAQALDIPGRSGMNKAELTEALRRSA